jgi:DNA-binding response OmpR family regulator
MMPTPLTILVCEDDHAVSELLKSLLDQENFLVSSAKSFADGIAMVERSHLDVIILVLDLPDQDGIAACRQFRRCSSAPILVLSSNGKSNFAEQILDAGADDYLVKPINNNLVLASLNKLARRARIARDGDRFADDPTL